MKFIARIPASISQGWTKNSWRSRRDKVGVSMLGSGASWGRLGQSIWSKSWSWSSQGRIGLTVIFSQKQM
jgi:hypothetical protein